MNIKVLGPGCAKCHSLDKTVREVVTALKLDADVEYVTDMKKIMQYHIMATPGLVINEKVVLSGNLPSKAEVEQLIMNALEDEDTKNK
jgi:small redox-active disulfide protein 2